MKCKFRGENDCIHDWCEKHFKFYWSFLKKSHCNVSTRFLIKRYYIEHGLVLDEGFVNGMLKSVSPYCVRKSERGHWDISMTSLFIYAKTKPTSK